MRKTLGVLLALSLFFFACGENTSSSDAAVKAGFIYIGPPEDVGWTAAHDQARLALDEKYDWLETVTVESVPEGTEAEGYHRAPHCGTQPGHHSLPPVLASWTRPWLLPPSTRTSSLSTVPDSRGQTTSVLTSVTFIRLTTSMGCWPPPFPKQVNWATLPPSPFPELFRHINAYALGARAVNPEATVDVKWTYKWYGPDLAKEAAEALIARRCGRHRLY
jgi:basic membrane protein A